MGANAHQGTAPQVSLCLGQQLGRVGYSLGAPCLADEVASQQRNVLAPLPERWQPQGDEVDAVVEVPVLVELLYAKCKRLRLSESQTNLFEFGRAIAGSNVVQMQKCKNAKMQKVH